jgi:flagellar basal body-associated protein FliL
MAEEQERKEEELSSDEKKKLEAALLDTSEGGGEATSPDLKGKIQKILSDKKLLMIFGGGALVLLIAVGAGVYFMTFGAEEEIVPVEEDQVDKKIIEETSIVEKVNIYKLEPFFLPIREGDKETGKFLSLSTNLLMSNSKLNKDLDKVLPLIRKKIYDILLRKRPADFTLQRAKTEERIKNEILTASNATLLSGTGTIIDVFFLNFMIK